MIYEKIVLSPLDISEALRYMGHKGNEVPAAVLELMRECEKKVMECAKPKYLYRVCDISECTDGVMINETNYILQGNDIRNHLKGCNKAVIMCATLSADIDRLIRITQKQDIARALAVDALASTAIEQVCDKAEALIKQTVPQYHMNWRYGIGYGDFPIQQQKDILEFLDAPRKIGLNVTGAYMLTPGKSVTAVMGLSLDEFDNKKQHGCDTCRLNGTCQFRKEGKYCND